MFNANQKPQYDPDVIDLCSDEEMDDASNVSAANDQTNANIDKHDVPELVKQSLTRFDIKGQVEACTQRANEIGKVITQALTGMSSCFKLLVCVCRILSNTETSVFLCS